MIENVPDLQEGELDVYRSDNDTKGRLFTVNYHDYNSNVGSIYLKNDQIQIRMNPDRELLREEAREIAQNAEQFLAEVKDDKTEVMEIVDLIGEQPLKEAVKEEMPSVGLTGAEILKDVKQQVNDELKRNGMEMPTFESLMMDRTIKEMEKADKFASAPEDLEPVQGKPNLFMVRKAMKEELRTVKEDLYKTFAEITIESEKAKDSTGITAEKAQEFVSKAKEISDQTKYYISLKEQLPTRREAALDMVKTAAESVKTTIKEQFNKLERLVDRGIKAGRNALHQIKDSITHANERFAAGKDTAYTGLTEKVEQIHRNWMATTYSIDKSIAQTCEQIRNNLEQHYDKKQEIKAAFKDGIANIGRAFTGQERQMTEVELTDRQFKVLDFLADKAESARENMAQTKQDYELSLAITQQNIRGAQEHRQEVGLDTSKKLKDILQDAKDRHKEHMQNQPKREKRERDARSNDAPERSLV